MIAFIDDHRRAYGVEPICKVLPIAPSTYHDHVAKRVDPTKLSARAKRDRALRPEIARVFAENFVGSTRSLAELRSRRVRDADLGRLFQQSSASGAYRQHPTGGSRGTLLRYAKRAEAGGVTQTR
jgi:putative transposase